MFMILLALFIAVPLLELWAIFETGSRIGFLPTLLALLLISIAGAALAKRQGYRALARIQQEVSLGQMPGDSLIDGALILAGALLLLTPGFITDAVGLLVLLPPSRIFFRRWIRRRLKKAVANRTIFFGPGRGPGGGFGGGPGGRDPGSYPPSGGPGAYPGPAEPEQRRKELEN